MPRCSKIVYSGSLVRGYPCKLMGKIKRDGKFYCRQHDPVKRQEIEEKKDQEYKLKWAAKEKEFHKLKTYDDLLIAAKIAYQVMSERLYHLDANPMGVVDLLGSAIHHADK